MRGLLIAAHLVAALSVWACGRARTESEGRVITATMDNGLTVVLSASPGATLVEVDLWFASGSAEEPPHQSGLAHVAEHVFSRVGVDPSNADPGRLNIEFGPASTNYDRARFTVHGAPPALDAILDIHARRMRTASAAVTAERAAQGIEEVLSEIALKHKQPYTALRALVDTRSMPFVDAAAVWPLGRSDAVGRLTRDDIADWIRRHFTPENAVLIVVGNFDERSALEGVRTRFGSLPRLWPDTKDAVLVSHRSLIRQPVKEMFTVAQGPAERVFVTWNLAGIESYDSWAIDVVRQLLDDRVRKSIVRQKHLATFVSSALASFAVFSQVQLELGFEGAPARPDLADEVMAELRRIVDGRVSETDCRHISRELATNFLADVSDPAKLLFRSTVLAEGQMFLGDARYHMEQARRAAEMDCGAIVRAAAGLAAIPAVVTVVTKAPVTSRESKGHL